MIKRISNKLHSDFLSNLFTKIHRGRYVINDKNRSFGWNYKNNNIVSKKIFYALGCSWLHSNFFNKVFLNEYPDYMLINRSVGGMGNSMMIDILKKDLGLLNLIDKEIYFLISFSEVGRNQKDFSYKSPLNYTSVHDYFGDILKEQYNEIKDILKNKNCFITTSFIPNVFNSHKTILDYAGPSLVERPKIGVYNYDSKTHEFLKNSKIFKFNHADDIKHTLNAIEWFSKHKHVDNTYHINNYYPYEGFLSNLNL